MSATLREYVLGKFRTKLWKRYDVSMKVIAEFGQKFEKDEQEGANNAFRHRYRKVIHLVHAVVNEPTTLRGLSADGPMLDEAPFVRELVTPQMEHAAVFGPPLSANENVGDWNMLLAYRFPDGRGDVVVCIPVGLTEAEVHKAHYAAIKMLQHPAHGVQDDESLAFVDPTFPAEIGAVEFMRGVKQLVAAARDMVEDLDDRAEDEVLMPGQKRCLEALRAAVEPFGEEQ